jgi:uncharacterized protein (TIGR02594 family)
MNDLGKRVVAIAKGEIGVGEQPPGSNRGPKVQEYQRATWLPGTGWPWCAAFTCWCYRQAGHPLPEPSAGAFDLVDRAVSHGWGKEVPVSQAKPGDLVAFRIGSGHVGLFESRSAREGTVNTIDGNTSDKVARRTRPAGLIYRVVRVAESAGSEQRIPKPPFSVVVTSESGTRQVVYRGRLPQALNQAARKLRNGAAAVTIRRRRA